MFFFVLWELSDLDWVGSTGIVTGVTQTSGPAAVDISFTSDSISIITRSGTNNYAFDIETEHETIPVPSSLSLLVAGVVGYGVVRRRKRSR